MREITINGQKREATGKKASKTMRKEGLVPCNLYGEKKDGKGLPEAVAFSVPFTEIRKAVYTPHVYIVTINLDGTPTRLSSRSCSSTPRPMLCCTQTSTR